MSTWEISKIMKIVKWVSFLIFLLLSNSLLAQTVGPLAENDEIIFRASRSSADTYLTMVLEKPTGNGATESDPFETWVPIDATLNAGDAQDKQTIITPNSDLPVITSGGGLVSVHLRFLVYVTNDTAETYEVVAAAKKEDNSFLAINVTAVDLGEDQFQIDINMDQTNGLCQELGSACTSFTEAAIGSREKDFIIYIYATTGPLLSYGSTVDPSGSHSGGIYYKVNMSDKVPTKSLTLSSIQKGDGRLTMNFSGGLSIGNMTDELFYKTLIYDFNKDLANVIEQGIGLDIDGALGTSGNIHILNPPQREGAVDIKSLENDRTYNLAVALVNKYQFANTLSKSLVETPIEIEALLKKQACYLVTAGFQREHYILDFFRSFRDQVLLKSTIGAWLVKKYYKTAPDYAPLIYNSKILSFLVKGFSYGLFYTMKVYPLFLFIFIMLFLRFSRNKLLIKK